MEEAVREDCVKAALNVEGYYRQRFFMSKGGLYVVDE
jgi:hypothetical protein